MTYKAIHFDEHAARRLRQRGITRQGVQWLLAFGERTAAPTFGGSQRWICRGYLGRQEAEVVFIEDAHQITIVTVTWVNDIRREPV